MAEKAPTRDAPLAERLVSGDKRALARAITLIENGDPEGCELVREVFPRTGRARIVGITGPPGVGKSTLIGALTKELREADREVGVLSIDPSSPFTRGALLGDRIRLSDHFLDAGVFIRSMASRGALGGLSEAALQAALLMDASGKDDVLLETVGVGQAEIDIVDHGDTIVLALRNVLALGPQQSWNVPVIRTEASRGEGVTELLERIDDHRRHITEEGTLEERRARNLRNEVLGLAAAKLRRDLEGRAGEDPAVAEMLERVVRREI